VRIKIIFLSLVSIILLSSCCDYIEPKVGERYLYSMLWDNDNPFDDKYIDTVTVLAIKDGYVKFKKSDGYVTSRTLNYFIGDIREIPKSDTIRITIEKVIIEETDTVIVDEEDEYFVDEDDLY